MFQQQGPRPLWFCSFFALALTILAYPDDDPVPLYYFMLGFLILAFLTRVISLYRTWRGSRKEHSRYEGRPWLHLIFPRWREVTVKWVESLIVMAV